MAVLLDFVSARDQRELAAHLTHVPCVSASWTLSTEGRLVCTWHEERLSHGLAENT